MKLKNRVYIQGLAVIVLLQLASVAFGLTCNTIQSGLITDKNGNPVTLGFDQWGYNYQAHIYEGLYANVQRPNPPYTEENCSLFHPIYGCAQVQMKWNDAWLSNKDCNVDGKLDWVNDGGASGIGSGAWLTNHWVGSYTLVDDLIHWTDFIKIVAAPTSADHCLTTACLANGVYGEGIWYTDSLHTTEIGPAIWGSFAVIQEVWNDPGAGVSGIFIKSPVNPGFGYWGKQP
jgi:hypothetical protein